MSNQVKLGQPQQALSPSNEPANGSEGELVRWQRLCKELVEERDRLRAELAETRQERDYFLDVVYDLTGKEFSFSKEEVFSQVAANKQSLGEFIHDLEGTRGTKS